MWGRMIVLAVIAILVADPPVSAQTLYQGHSGGHGTAHSAGYPVMPGQDLFGAVMEIVRILTEDPDTDWRKIDIDALRAHLLDMHLVATRAAPTAEAVAGGLRMSLDREGPAGGAAERMMSAHGPILEAEFGWRAVLETADRSLVWTVRATGSDDDAARIRALGFFGLLASGAHHQDHHLAIARGAGHPHH